MYFLLNLQGLHLLTLFSGSVMITEWCSIHTTSAAWDYQSAPLLALDINMWPISMELFAAEVLLQDGWVELFFNLIENIQTMTGYLGLLMPTELLLLRAKRWCFSGVHCPNPQNFPLCGYSFVCCCNCSEEEICADEIICCNMGSFFSSPGANPSFTTWPENRTSSYWARSCPWEVRKRVFWGHPRKYGPEKVIYFPQDRAN